MGAYIGRSLACLLGCIALSLCLASSTSYAAVVVQATGGAVMTEPGDSGTEDAAGSVENSPAAVADDALPKQALRVVVAGSPPFVRKAPDGQPAGPSVEVWQRAADRLGLNYNMRSVDNVEAALREVEAGTADVAVGPISVTAKRAERVEFTQPYFQSSLGIVAREENEFLSRIEPFLSVAFLTAIGALLFVLSIVGVLIWLAERKENASEFPRKFLPGVGNGIWFALVTMTTVGYGDRSPKSFSGRVVAGCWMLVALITVSSLTAGIATALTLSQLGPTAIEKAGDLEGLKVATLRGTLAEQLLHAQGAHIIYADDIEGALGLLSAQAVQAVVFDRPALTLALRKHSDKKLVLSPRRYMEQGYGFALRHHAEIAPHLDMALLASADDNATLFEDLR